MLQVEHCSGCFLAHEGYRILVRKIIRTLYGVICMGLPGILTGTIGIPKCRIDPPEPRPNGT